jgi:hypothetical protein
MNDKEMPDSTLRCGICEKKVTKQDFITWDLKLGRFVHRICLIGRVFEGYDELKNIVNKANQKGE